MTVVVIGSVEYAPATRRLVGPRGMVELMPAAAGVLDSLLRSVGKPVAASDLQVAAGPGVALSDAVAKARACLASVGADALRLVERPGVGWVLALRERRR